jgi:hypothetical protein
MACLVSIKYVINEFLGGKKYFLYLFIKDCRVSLELGIHTGTVLYILNLKRKGIPLGMLRKRRRPSQ